MAQATETPVVPDAPKPGYQSTELLAALAAAIGMPALNVPPQYMPYITGIAVAYIVCRTVLKAVHTYGLAKNIPDLPDLPALPPLPPLPPTPQVPK